MKKITLFLAFIIFSVSGIMFSCKIDEEQLNEEPFIYEAKNWLTKQITDGKNAREKKQRFNLNVINWSKAVSVKYQNYKEAIEIPLENKGITKYKINTIEYTTTQTTLRILKDNKGTISSNIIDIFIDEAESKKKNNLFAIETLNGVVITSNLNQKVTSLSFLKNGKKKGKGYRIFGIKECWNLVYYECDVSSDGVPYNCNYVIMDSWCDNAGGNGTGGSGYQDITNNVTNPCISGVVSDFLSNSHGINTLIQSVFSCNADVNLVFSNDNINVAHEAETQILNKGEDSGIPWLNVEITINNNQSNHSKEYIASIVIHEALHAYMNNLGQPMGNDPQHMAMGQNYINLMRDYLQTNYGISSRDATILALGGLEEYSWFPTILSSNNISLNDYWTKKSDYKNHTSGNYCN